MPIRTDVCIVGGGPAGIMLGLLLARRRIQTMVMEQHGDFLRDFRGDTVHPSTLDVLDELGLGGAVAQVPHRDVMQIRMTFADGAYQLADFSRLRVRHPYIRFMPQWDFLDVLWFRLGRDPAGPSGLDMHVGPGRMLLAIDRDDYWQIAYVIRKGGDQEVRAADLRASCADPVQTQLSHRRHSTDPTRRTTVPGRARADRHQTHPGAPTGATARPPPGAARYHRANDRHRSTTRTRHRTDLSRRPATRICQTNATLVSGLRTSRESCPTAP